MTEPEDIESLVGRFGGWLQVNGELYGVVFLRDYYRFPDANSFRAAWRDWQSAGGRVDARHAELTRRQFDELKFLVGAPSELPEEEDVTIGSRILPVDGVSHFERAEEGKWHYKVGGEIRKTVKGRPKRLVTKTGTVQYRDAKGRIITSRKVRSDDE